MSNKAHPPELKKYMEKRVSVKIERGRHVTGILRGFDPYMNIVLEDTIEEISNTERNSIGMVVVRGNSIVIMQSLSNINSSTLRFYYKISTNLIPIHFILFSIGIIWLSILPLEDYNGKCYISENALLVGMIELKFSQDYNKAKTYTTTRSDLKAHGIAVEYFDNLQFEVAQQNFSINLPSLLVESGVNTYALFHAERSSHTEMLVVHISMNNHRLTKTQDIANFAVFLGLADYFSQQNYWARDILFLMTSHDVIGVQAWLQQYLGIADNSQILTSQSLHYHPGNIIAMISIKLKSEFFNLVRIKTEGVNGMLPNLDLVNTISFVAMRNLRMATNFFPSKSLEYKDLLYNTLYMAWNQVTGIPTGPHGPFLHYGIQGLTIEAVNDPTVRTTRLYSPAELGNLVESYMRSLNNLLETLHQSFNFYLLPGNNRYISIGIYIPPLMCILAPLVLKALVFWISYQYPWLSDPNNIPLDNKELSIKLLHSNPIPLESIGTILLAYTLIVLLIITHKYLYLFPGFPFAIVLTVSLITFRFFTNVTKENAPFFHSLLLLLLTMSTVALSIVNFPIALIISLILTIFTIFPRLIPIFCPIFILAPHLTLFIPDLSFLENLYLEYEISHRVFDGWGYSAIFLILVPLFIYKNP
ncbi:Glycosylphosphatidylinositol anchor attachment 1 protein-like [Oopsacas minuta]|uniref:Sm protein G n=1 Tax=Oopsacas minuta TaxID=111878 RepID=A0AAV7JV65_9METZ|nr:Glycosylphosphatidylinositol anchor attachment 1 protein-like [Oopsacas minuta]